MIVCVCRGISDRHLEALVRNGADTPQRLEELCGAGGDCGSCRDEVERIVDRAAVCPQPVVACAALLRARP